MSRRDVTQVLRWIANGQLSLPDEVCPEASELLEAVVAHKVERRLIARLSRAETPWASTELRARIGREAMAVLQSHERYLGELAHLDRLVHQLDISPVILLKGPAVATYLKRPDLLRRCSDVDLLPARGDIETLVSALKSQGYRDAGEAMPHEAASLGHSDRMWIDVHRHFPAWSYPQKTTVSGTVVGITDSELAYDNFRGGAQNAYGLRFGKLLVPSLEMLTATLVAHVFRDYVEAPFNMRLAKVRLSELIEIRTLLEGGILDMERLGALIQEHALGEATDLAETLLAQLYGVEWYKEDGAGDRIEEAPRTFPRELARGLLAPAPADLDALLSRPPSLDDVLGRFPYFRLQDGMRSVLESSSVHMLSAPNEPWISKLSLEAVCDEVGLALEVAVSCDDSASYLDEVQISFGNETLYWAYYPVEQSMKVFGSVTEPSVEWSWAPAAFVVRISAPWSALGGDGRPSVVDLVLAVQRFEEPPGPSWPKLFSDNVRSVAIPLRIGAD